MEWTANHQPYTSLEESFYGILPSPSPDQGSGGTQWTYEENKMFEDALSEFEISSPDFFHNLAAKLPWKTVDDVKRHYQALLDDVRMIESGRVPVPQYEDDEKEEEEEVEETGKGKGVWVQENDGRKGRRSRHQRRRGVPWTEEEHQLFLMGLNKYGKGDWRSISRYYVITKTPTQVASHAQKYFRRMNSLTPAERRRPSIHDIQTVNTLPSSATPTPNPTPILTPINDVAITLDASSAIIPNLGTQINPMQLNPNFPAVEQNPNYFLGMASTSSSASFPPAVVPAAAAAFMNAPANAYMYSAYGNNQMQMQMQPWGGIN